jgi:hypothetical protein
MPCDTPIVHPSSKPGPSKLVDNRVVCEKAVNPKRRLKIIVRLIFFIAHLFIVKHTTNVIKNRYKLTHYELKNISRTT